MIKKMRQILLNVFVSFCCVLMTTVAYGSGTLTPQELFMSGVAHLKKGEYENAITELEAARMMSPSNIRLLYQLGLAHYNKGMEDDLLGHIKRAQSLWQEAIELMPEGDTSMLKSTLEDIVSRANRRKDDVDDRLSLEEVLSKNPDALEEGLAYAKVLMAKGRRDDAAKLYQRLADAHPRDPRPYTEMAIMVKYMGRLLWAERYFEQALQRVSTYEPARKGMGELYESLEALRVEGYESLVELSH